MKSILIIEDNLEIRENIEEILMLHGYKTYSSCNGKNGIEIAKRENPELILCDISMPGKNGFEVLEAIMNPYFGKKIPFVFLTASAEEKDVTFGKSLKNVNAYLTKPFQTEDLLNTIKKHI